MNLIKKCFFLISPLLSISSTATLAQVDIKLPPAKTQATPKQPPLPASTFKHSTKPELVYVVGGTFKMGSNKYEDEKPIHQVTLRNYYIGKYLVTVAQYRAYCKDAGVSMPTPPAWGWIESHPIVNIKYYEAEKYCKWLSKKYGGNWRLPTEAEWEYAAGGGIKSKKYKFSGSNNLDIVAWYGKRNGTKTHPVGSKSPNELSIYDMSGNVWEWCSDWYDEDYYSYSPSSNPRGPEYRNLDISYLRVLRGGSWFADVEYCRINCRYAVSPHLYSDDNGFRVVFSK